MKVSSRMFGLAVVVVFAGASIASSADPATEEENPFRDPRVAQAPTAPAGDADLDSLQLSGISIIGGTSMFNLVDARTNRGFWIALKGNENGFSVLSHDANADSVVVSHGGRTRVVSLRQARIAALPTAPATGPVPNPAVNPTPFVPTVPSGMPTQVVRTADGGEIKNPKTPQEVAQAETEARMLVSDLLEISMQERARQKALREAQQKKQ